MDFEKIGKRIKECRESKGMSLNDLADKFKLSFSFIWRMEKGERQNLKLAYLWGMYYPQDLLYILYGKR